METDRNVLFAVLALRAGLIDADQFAAACDRWSPERKRPLANLLVQPGGLNGQDQQHVEYLLERHTQQHGSAEKALAALADASVRSAIAGVRDPELRDWLAGVVPGGLWIDDAARSAKKWGMWIVLFAGVVLLIGIGGTGVMLTSVMLNKERDVLLQQARAAEAQALANMAQAEASLRQNQEDVTRALLQVAGTADDPQAEKVRDRLMEQLLAKAKERLRKNPSDANARRAAADAYEQVGGHQRALGRHADAEASFREALKLCDELAQEQRGMPGPRQRLARCQLELAQTLRDAGKRKEAEDLFRLAIGGFEQSRGSPSPSGSGQAEYDLARALTMLAELLQESERWLEAEQSIVLAHHWLQILASRSGRENYRRDFARVLQMRGSVLMRLKRFPEAEAALGEAIADWQRVVADQPENPDHRSRLVEAYETLAKVLKATGRPAEADAALKKAKAEAKKD